MASVSANIPQVPHDQDQECMVACALDSNPAKVDLAAGVYCDEDGKPWVFPTVKKAARLVLEDPSHSYSYGPVLGDPEFLQCSRNLLFGNHQTELHQRIASVQTISGTGANHMGVRLLVESVAPNTVWLADPTWNNHQNVWMVAGPGVQQRQYPYFDWERARFDFEGMMATLRREGAAGDVVVVQVCAHNPTGSDPSREQWAAIAELCQSRGFVVFMDCAYQGYASDDLDEDVWPVRYFAQQGLEFMVAQSFSKSFGLYGERVGAFHFVAPSIEYKNKAEAVMNHFQHSEILLPPGNGAKIVALILKDPEMRAAWLQDLQTVRTRTSDMRKLLCKELSAAGPTINWSPILDQAGMFCYLSLSEAGIRRLREQYHVYMMNSGRANISALNTKNIQAVVRAIVDVHD